jgi:hypothetical protein
MLALNTFTVAGNSIGTPPAFWSDECSWTEGKDDFETQLYCEEERDCPPPLPPKTLLRSVSGYGDRFGILNYSCKKRYLTYTPGLRVKILWIKGSGSCISRKKFGSGRILRWHRTPQFTV